MAPCLLHDRALGMTTAALSVPRSRDLTAGRRIERDALTDVAPMLVAVAPFALIIGVQIAAGTQVAGGLSGSLLLYAGSAQASALTLFGQGAGILAMLATITLVNSRFAVYSAALAPMFQGQPRLFRWLAPHFIIDQTFALVMVRNDLQRPERFRRYWLTIGLALAVVWVSSMTVGVLLGPAVPDSAALRFMPIAVFVGLLVPSLVDRPSVAAAMAGGAAAGLVPVTSGLRVLVGTTVGAVAGLLAERSMR
jgi:predicted branched-subunit amino acid permease